MADFSDISKSLSTTLDVSNLKTKDALSEALEELVEQVNTKRKRDEVLLADYKKALETEVAKAYSAVENSMFQRYEKTNTAMSKKIEELTEVMNKISCHEAELQEFRQSLSVLYEELQRDITGVKE